MTEERREQESGLGEQGDESREAGVSHEAEASPEPKAPVTRARPSRLRVWIRRVATAIGLVFLLIVLALLAGLTIDLGPTLRAAAEKAGSKYIQRPMHIGRLGIRLGRGDFLVEGLAIEGPTKTDHPTFTAKRIAVSLWWWTFFRTREVLIKSIDMSDWDMQIELKDGRDTMFKLPKGGGGKRSFTVTLESVHAYRGRFTYLDYSTWRTTSPNLEVIVERREGEYRGRANFSDGRVKIRDYEPFRSDMRCTFKLDGGKVHLNYIDLKTDGAQSVIAGDVDFGNWPEMLYRVRSHVQFPKMREIFFAREKFRLTGEGEFTGTFHLYKGGRDVEGDFASPLLLVNNFRFPDLAGHLRWLPDSFNVTKGSSRFHGGTAHFTYSIAPIGAPTPAIARFDASYENVDLANFTDYLGTKGLRLAGRASGRNLLEWPIGRFSELSGAGELNVRPPANAVLYTRASQPSLSVAGPPLAANAVPTVKAPGGVASYVGDVPDLGHVPLAGTLRYTYNRDWVDVLPSSVSTPATFIEFRGRTAYGERAAIDFYARSGDWQQSDNLLSAIITAFGSPTRTVMVGGYGEFTGRMLNSFRRPRIEGSFDGHDVRAFDVVWGRATGQVVVENGYVDVTSGVVTKGKAELRADGRFSLSTPRQDRGEEMNARVRLSQWPIPDLRHAFDLDAYPIDGRAGGEYHVYGAYRRPYGYGTLTVADGVAYNEPFERGVGALRLEGVGVRIDGIEIAKGGGAITGAAYLSWDGRYSFSAEGRRIPVEQLNALTFPQAPLSGIASFKVPNSNGAFASPRYRVEFAVADLFVGDEGIGTVNGAIDVRDQMMGLEKLEVSSPRLSVSGTGRISMAGGSDADLTFVVTDSVFDPYIRTLQPLLSPFTRATAGGTVRIVGPLSDPMRLLVDATVEQLHLSLFDYDLQNDGQLHLSFHNSVISLSGPASATSPRPPMRLVGKDTKLSLAGDINLGTEPYVDPRGSLLPGHSIGISAEGDANLGILQGVFRDIRSSGRASVQATITGPMDNPAVSGRATIADGRIRYASLPNSVDAITGAILLSAGVIRFGDARTPLTAQVGGGAVTFGGRIDLNGFTPTQWALTATGDNLHLRYPEGFNSTVDVDLALTGPYEQPTLKGTVNVTNALYAKTLDITPGLLVAAGAGTNAPAAPAASSATFPLRFDVHIIARSTLRVQSNLARMVASADLFLRGTYDHPVMLGRADVERGYANLAGKRYQVTHGAIEFRNPTRIEPDFDFETETRVRVPGQTFIVTLHLVGSLRQIRTIDVTSDPPLPTVDAWSLLFGDVRNASDLQNAELRRLQRPGTTQQQILTAQVEQLLFATATNNVNRVFERTFGLDSFQLTPSLFDAYQRLNPTAKLTIGKQISDRVYLTIASSLYAPQEDVIYVLQYDQSDRISWVLSRNEDKTYSLDVRVRHTF
jgi:hypothetical protein